MKRGGRINRYTPMPRPTRPMARSELKRGDYQLKRSRLRRQSKADRKLRKETRPDRELFVLEYPFCMCCGQTHCDLCVHEIAKGHQHRSKAVRVRLAQLVACVSCNLGELEDYAIWPIARQLAAVKKLHPEDYDRSGFHKLRGRADTDVTEAEVNAFIPTIIDAPMRKQKLKSAADLRLDLEHWQRKVLLLEGHLLEARTNVNALTEFLKEAVAREAAIKNASQGI